MNLLHYIAFSITTIGIFLGNFNSTFVAQVSEQIGQQSPQNVIEEDIETGDQLFNAGLNSFFSYQYQEAISYFWQAHEIYLETNNLYDAGLALHSIGRSYYNLGEYDNAADSYRQSLVVFKEINDPDRQAMAFNNLGIVYDTLGNYSSALFYYQRALALFEKTGNQLERARTFGNIALTYSNLSEYAKAIYFSQQSLHLHRKLGNRLSEVIVLTSIGDFYLKLGQNSAALDYYQQALNASAEISDLVVRGLPHNSFGVYYLQQGEYLQANDSFNRALDLYRQAGERFEEGRTLAYLGETLRQLRQYERALDVLTQALVIAEELESESFEGAVLDSLGNVYTELGRYRRAFEFYQQSLSISRRIGDRSHEAITLANIGRLVNAQGQPEVAIVFLKQSVNVRESIREGIRELDSDLQQSYTNTVADDYRFLADLLLSQGRITEAQQVLELLKLEELREFTRSARGLESDDGIALNAIEAEILEEFGTLVAFGKQVYECEQRRCVQLPQYRQQRQAQATRFDSQVTAFIQTIRDNRQTDDFFFDPRYLNETARDIVAQPGTLLIYPFVTEDQLWLLYTAAGDVAGAVPVDVTQFELGETVVHFRDLLESPHSHLPELQATGKQLYDWLIAPLETEIRENAIATLVFSQDRVTRYIPMGALWDGENYLTQQYTLSTILSAELTDMDDRLSPSPTETSVFALGLSESVRDFNPLPHVESELDAVVRVDETDALGTYPGVQLLNGDFNRDALAANLFGHRLVHIATHGKFVAGLPEESFLLLGNGEEFSIPDINSLGSDLRDVHLVVLSACETAVGGPGADGIEVAGISSYFLAANRASAVMASLWLVNDASTSLLMQQFYANLAEGTMTKAEALRQAQLTLLNGDLDPALVDALSRGLVAWDDDSEPSNDESAETVPDLSHPYYWAPFILIGNGL